MYSAEVLSLIRRGLGDEVEGHLSEAMQVHRRVRMPKRSSSKTGEERIKTSAEHI
jgi:hypothetical protein